MSKLVQLLKKTYHHLYTILPSKPDQLLLDSGLASAASNNLLDVDIGTLRHNKYENIFGLGDVCNLPTTKGSGLVSTKLQLLEITWPEV